MSNLPVVEVRPSTGSVEVDLVPVYQKKAGFAPVKGPYGRVLEKFKKGEAFSARASSVQFVRFGGKGKAQNVLYVGMGSASELTAEKARLAGGAAFSKLMAEKAKTAAINVDALLADAGTHLSSPELVRGFAEGLLLGCYSFNKYKSGEAKQAGNAPSKITFVTKNAKLQAALSAEVKQVHAATDAINLCRDWSNEPSNMGTPEYYAAEATRIAKQEGLKCTILSEKDAEKMGMGLFLGVGQGSEREGKIIVLEYNPKAEKSHTPKTIAFVGKGVTFDSGGISIKPSMKMEEMKHDMTGAATVFGAIVLAARWKVPNRVVAIMAFTENMPSGNAIQPGNIIKARNGKTVEIINTDAEGRLILADVLDYAHDFKPDAIVDVATLTGAVAVALGKYCCAILGNDPALITSLRDSGAANGERIWELPLFDEYFDDMKSDHADMRNSCNDPYGGTIRGAIFLKQFIRKGTAWAHLDIAATAYHQGHLSYMPKKGASGSYVRTLARFAADF